MSEGQQIFFILMAGCALSPDRLRRAGGRQGFRMGTRHGQIALARAFREDLNDGGLVDIMARIATTLGGICGDTVA